MFHRKKRTTAVRLLTLHQVHKQFSQVYILGENRFIVSTPPVIAHIQSVLLPYIFFSSCFSSCFHAQLTLTLVREGVGGKKAQELRKLIQDC